MMLDLVHELTMADANGDNQISTTHHHTMSTAKCPRLGHVAISAREPHRVAAFYRDLLDLQIVRDGGNPLTGDAVLLRGRDRI